MSMNAPRARLCGCSIASGMLSTGAKHESVPSRSAVHSAWVLEAKTSVSRRRSSGQPARSCWWGSSAGSSPMRVEQLVEELSFGRRNRHVAIIAGPVDRVVGRRAIEHVGAPLVVPHAAGPEPMDVGHERGHAVCHRRVDHLSLAGSLGFEQCADDAEGQQHPAPGEVAEEVQGNGWRTVGISERVQGAGQRDVVEVVSGSLCKRSLLAPAGHSPVDQGRVECEAFVGPETEPLHDSRSVALDETVSVGDQPFEGCEAVVSLDVERDRRAAAVEQVDGDVGVGLHRLGSVDAQDVGAQIGQHHGGVRARGEAGHLDDSNALKWSHGSPC